MDLKIKNSILGFLLNQINIDHNWEININLASKIFLMFLKNKNTKKKTILWISNLLNQNKKRRQLNSHDETFYDCSSYKFLINLTGILYLLWNKGINVKKELDFNYLINNDSGLEWLLDGNSSKSYSFLEDCFFLLFRSFDLSFISIIENVQKLKDDKIRMKNLIDTYKCNESDNESINEIVQTFNIDRMNKILNNINNEIQKKSIIINNIIILNWYSKFINYFSQKLYHFDLNFNIDDILNSIVSGCSFLLKKKLCNFDLSIINLAIKNNKTNNPHVKCNYIKFISKLIHIKEFIIYG